MGVLGWAPAVFWHARVMDIMDAVDGAMMREGSPPDDIEAEIEQNRRKALQAEFRRLMEQYPDG